MDRPRRSQSSGDKRTTSLLIQQLAAARERKLQGGLASATKAGTLLEASDFELLDSDSSSSEDIEDADSPAMNDRKVSSVRNNHPLTQRSRYFRKDQHIPRESKITSISEQPTMNATVDDLANMIQSIGISARSQPVAQEHYEHRHPSSRNSDNSNHDNVAESADQPQHCSRTSTHGHRYQQPLGSNARQPASGNNSMAHEQAPKARSSSTAKKASFSKLVDSSDSDEEFASHIPRSRKPAIAASPSEEHHKGELKPSICRASSECIYNRHATADDDSCGSDEGDSDAEVSKAAVNGTLLVASCSGRAASSQSSGTSSSSNGGIRPYLKPKPAAAAAAADPAKGSLVLEDGFCLDVKVASKLYPHQVQGVKWLWSLHRMRKGGILADDMGLGKTMQCSAFLAGSLRSHQAVRALVIAPKTLLAHWEKELRVCGMAAHTHCFYGSSEGERAAALRTLTGRGGVMLTTYGMVLHNAAQLRQGLGPVARDADEHEDELDLLCPDPPPGRRILWDYVILDEGHKIKNSRTQLAQRLRELRAMTRVIISGTPVQNNLSELHSLMDFAVPGLLGGAKEFKMIYEKAITAGQDRDASLRVRELGAAKAAELRKIVAPFMLRREKKEVLGSGSKPNTASPAEPARGISGASGVVAAAATSSSECSGAAASPAPMGSKHDLVIWLRLQPLQRHIYEAFLHSAAVKEALNSTRSPLAALTVLKKVCDHPALLSERATNIVLSAASKPHKQHIRTPKTASKQRRNSLDDFIVDDDDGDYDDDDDDDDDNSDATSSRHSTASYSDDDSASKYDRNSSNATKSKAAASRAALAAELDDAGFSDEFITWAESEGFESRLLSDVHQKGTEASCKSLFVTALLESLVGEGHRTLVFSQSRVMLDILQAAVVARGWRYCRIDGSMASAEARQAEVNRFQAPGADIPVFLLTTQVGGLGLTLTAANRVVIVDPSWNPATDNQSVDRAYRIGQSRDVIVYRLVTCGTVEEKIYRKQVFKGGLSKAGMEEGIQLRYFTHQELHELFRWDPAALSSSETQQLLTQQHSSHTREILEQNPELATHVKWIEDFPLCAGTSEHGLLFSELDPEGKTLQLTRPEYMTATAAHRGLVERGARGFGSSSSSSSKGRKGAGLSAVSGSAAAAGPSAAEISTMLATLNIAGSGSSSSKSGGAADGSAAAKGSGAAAAGGSSAAAAAAAEQRHVVECRVRDLEISLQKVTADVDNLATRLPDGGLKLKARQAELLAALETARQQLQQLAPVRDHLPHTADGRPGSAAEAAVPDKQRALVDGTNSTTANPVVQQHQHQQHQHQQQQARPLPTGHNKQHPSGQAHPSQQVGRQLLLQQQQRQFTLPPSMQQQQWSAHAGHSAQQQQQQLQQRHHEQPPPPPPPPPRAGQPYHSDHEHQQHHQQQQQQQRHPHWQRHHHLGSSLLQQHYVDKSTNDAAAPELSQRTVENSNNSTNIIELLPQRASSSKDDSCQKSQQPSSSAAVTAASDQLPPGLTAETLDGRVPTLSELRQRRHVLRKALQHEDQLKAKLQAQGQAYSPSRQQRWLVMYQEYKEIKQLLQKADDMMAAGRDGGQRSSRTGVDMINLT